MKFKTMRSRIRYQYNLLDVARPRQFNRLLECTRKIFRKITASIGIYTVNECKNMIYIRCKIANIELFAIIEIAIGHKCYAKCHVRIFGLEFINHFLAFLFGGINIWIHAVRAIHLDYQVKHLWNFIHILWNKSKFGGLLLSRLLRHRSVAFGALSLLLRFSYFNFYFSYVVFFCIFLVFHYNI